jgi:hypothetical protein
MEPPVTFGDVSGSGAGGTKQLIAEPVTLLFGKHFAERPRDKYPQNPTRLPAVEVFK